MTLLRVILVLAASGGFIALDRLVLDPGGRGFAGDANDKCAAHHGVRWMNAQQGTIVCGDGWAAE